MEIHRPSGSYARLNQRTKMLHINPIKNCGLFPGRGICKNFTAAEISEYNCTACNNYGPGGMYNGRPQRFEYTPESSCDWKWTRCNDTPKGCNGTPVKNTKPGMWLGNKSNFDCEDKDFSVGVL